MHVAVWSDMNGSTGMLVGATGRGGVWPRQLAVLGGTNGTGNQPKPLQIVSYINSWGTGKITSGENWSVDF
jgi:hypothetical protein